VGGRRPPLRQEPCTWCAGHVLRTDRWRQEHLAVAEEGFVLVLAPSRDQAKLVHRYAKGFIDASPMLKNEVLSETADQIGLSPLEAGCAVNAAVAR
jgi:hypothetical protein